jgi:hypothetical protein
VPPPSEPAAPPPLAAPPPPQPAPQPSSAPSAPPPAPGGGSGKWILFIILAFAAGVGSTILVLWLTGDLWDSRSSSYAAPNHGSTGPTGSGTSPYGSSTTTGTTGTTGTTLTQAAGDRTAPKITKVLVRRGRLSFRLSEAARTTIAFQQRRSTRSRVLVTKATRKLAGRRGTNRLTIPKKLGKGRYRITLVAVDKAGNRSRPVRITLTVR